MAELLSQQLAAKEDLFRSRFPAENEGMEQSIEELRASGEAPGLVAGDRAPDFTLTDALGRTVRLQEEREKGLVVLIFYRGSWCPFCSLQLRAYQSVAPQLNELGARLIAVSPQRPDPSAGAGELEKLPYIVAADPGGDTAGQYRVRYEVGESLEHVYRSLGIDLGERNSNGRWILPVPSVFVIDRTSTIRYAHTEPNFRRRLEPEALLQAVRSL